MTDRRITRQDLLDYQAALRKAADGLDSAIHLADMDLSQVGLEPDKKQRLTPEGRNRVIEANRAHWVTCPRPECKGVRHRKTHPHIAGQGNKPPTKTKGRTASKSG